MNNSPNNFNNQTNNNLTPPNRFIPNNQPQYNPNQFGNNQFNNNNVMNNGFANNNTIIQNNPNNANPFPSNMNMNNQNIQTNITNNVPNMFNPVNTPNNINNPMPANNQFNSSSNAPGIFNITSSMPNSIGGNNLNMNSGMKTNNQSSDIDDFVKEKIGFMNNQNPSKFINQNVNASTTKLDNLPKNDISYKKDYSMDEKVQANLIENEKKQNSITITNEMKVFLIICLILLVSMFALPVLFDLINNI